MRISVFHRLKLLPLWIALGVGGAGIGTFAATIEDYPRYPILAACTGYEDAQLWHIDDSEYAEDRDAIDIWSERYHAQVELVIEDYQEVSDDIDCLGEESTGVLAVPDEMFQLAYRLRPWEDADEAFTLRRADMSAVMQEYLRSYECALMERHFFLTIDVAKELKARDSDSIFLRYIDIFHEMLDQQKKIYREIAVARPTLIRTLSVIGSADRLNVLETEVECLQRASLDLRNGFALAAESMSCMNRTWNAKDPLRDHE